MSEGKGGHPAKRRWHGKDLDQYLADLEASIERDRARIEAARAEEDQVIATLGLSVDDALRTLQAKVAALGFELVELEEDPGGFLSTYSLYHAGVVDRREGATEEMFTGIERTPSEAICRAAARAFTRSKPTTAAEA